MSFNRESKFKLITNFINICEENDIWYSLDNYSLLGLKRHGGFVPWVEKFQAFLTPFSYEKLRRLSPNKIIDSSQDLNFKSYKAFFLEKANQWNKEQDFIEIRICVPTTVKKILKFRRNLSNFFRRNYDFKLAINKLYEEKYEGFYLIDHPYPENKLWIANLSFEREKGLFNNIEVQFVKEWDKVLINQFGQEYMKASVPKKYYVYPKPLERLLVES